MRSRGVVLAVGTFAVAALAAVPSGASQRARVSSLHPTPWSVVRVWMHRTREAVPGGERFGSLGPRVTTSDGHGGALTAVIGLRRPSADGRGQLVFFFHGRRFLGWDGRYEHAAISSVRAAGSRRFDVRYVRYRPGDPLCCPSGGIRRVRFRFDGGRVHPLSRIPSDPPPRRAVRLR